MQSRALTIISTLILGTAAVVSACGDDSGGGGSAGTGGQGGSAGSGNAGSAGSAGHAGSAGSAGSGGSAGSSSGGSGGAAGHAGTGGSAGSSGSAGAGGGDAGTQHGTCDTFDADSCVSTCLGINEGFAPQCGSLYVAMVSCFVSANSYECSPVDQEDPLSSPEVAAGVCVDEQGAWGDCVGGTGGDAGTADPTSVCQSYCAQQQDFQNGVHGGDAGTDAGVAVDAGADASG